MVTKQFIKQNLKCSDIYVQKLINYAHGDEKVLYELFIQKLNERGTRQAICEVG